MSSSSSGRSPNRRGTRLAVAALLLALPACQSAGSYNPFSFTRPGFNFSLFGYCTQPNYDPNIRTVRVPIFKNKTYWVVDPTPGLEMNLTQAVVREIEEKTPYKVVSASEPADTELLGTIVTFTKGILNYNQLNEVREAETTLVVELIWKDLRTGKILTAPARRAFQPYPPEATFPPGSVPPALAPGQPNPLVPINSTPTRPTTDAVAAAPSAPGAAADANNPIAPPLPGPVVPTPPPVLVRSVAHFRPEVGESITTAMQKNINRMAVQIVAMMEQPW